MKLSIIIPVYNSELYIGQCIESILRQPFGEIEIILVNDGSTDGSQEVCAAYANQYDNILLVNKPNGGVSSARNIGLQYARGAYVTFVDSDDQLSPMAITSDLFTTDYDIIEIPHPGIGSCHFAHDYVCRNHEEVFQYMSSYMFNACWGRLYKTDLLKQVRFPEQLKMGEDLVFLLRLFPAITTYLVKSGTEGYLYNSENEDSAMHRLGYLADLEKLCSHVIEIAKETNCPLAWYYITHHCYHLNVENHTVASYLSSLDYWMILASPLSWRQKIHLIKSKIVV